MIKSKLFALAICTSFILFPSVFFSQPRVSPGLGAIHRKGHAPCLRALELGLSPDQMKQLELLHQSFYREAHPLRAELFAKYLELRESLTNPATTLESIHAKNAEIILLQSKLEEKTVHYLIKVRGLLTVEQLKMWCPEQEFPSPRRMMPGLMGPMGRSKTYPLDMPRRE